MRARVFLACSTEQLAVGRAIQANLQNQAHVRLWTKGIFRLSRSAIESLERVLSEFDCGIFILAPDDVATIRQKRYHIVRSNIIFELGLFVGALGRDRAFLVAPSPLNRLHLPSDLAGLIFAPYPPRKRGSWRKTLQPACQLVREGLLELKQGARRRPQLRIERVDFFEEYKERFASLFRHSQRLTTFFIHSRRWREDNIHNIRAFLARPNTRLIALVPEPKDRELHRIFRRNFEDGRRIPALVEDCCNFYLQLAREFSGKVELRFVTNYPTYSFYQFDNVVIAAMYPTTSRKKQVPTFQVYAESEFGSFIQDDLQRLLKASRRPSRSEVRRFSQ